MTSSGLSLPPTSPFFAPERVQASADRANERRRIHSTFPAMFGPFLPANAAVRDGGWECKSYVCISCQTYTPSVQAAAMAQAAGIRGGRFWRLVLLVGSSLFVARSGRPDQSQAGSVGRRGCKAAAKLTFSISCHLHPSSPSCWFRKRLWRPAGALVPPPAPTLQPRLGRAVRGKLPPRKPSTTSPVPEAGEKEVFCPPRQMLRP